ncbi:MAG: PPOX class F420-dependent oxidoreductase [Nocardioidaceae bacterium]
MALDSKLLALVAERNLGTLATLKRDGRPQLSNINYHFDPHSAMVKISVTDDRAKVHNLRRDPRASLFVSSEDGWSYTVCEGDVEFSAVAAQTDDPAVEELVELYRLVRGEDHPDWDGYRQAMVNDRRLVARLHVGHAYGVAARG